MLKDSESFQACFWSLNTWKQKFIVRNGVASESSEEETLVALESESSGEVKYSVKRNST